MNDLYSVLSTSLQIILLLIGPLIHLRYGKAFLNGAHRIFKLTPASEIKLSDAYFPGLTVFLLATFALRCCGLSWEVTTLITHGIVLLKPANNSQILSDIKKYSPSWNFALWIVVAMIIGISLVDTTTTIRTPWINSYGDLAFHTGMITSFAFGDNFPPVNQTFAGIALTYPFLVNLWTASLLWMDTSLSSFGIVLAFQWLVIWITIYNVVNGDKLKILPWAFLFGGGSLFTLYSHSGENIKNHYPWSVFLTTIWIPQRSALFGLLGLTTIIKSFHSYLKDFNFSYLIFAGVTLSLSLLVHTHFALVMFLYMTLSLILLIPTKGFRPFVAFGIAMIPALLSLPWLLGKQSIIYYRQGWMPWSSSVSTYPKFFGALDMWIHNGVLILLLVLAILIVLKAFRAIAILAAIFIAGNFVHFAVWEWDQIKIFTAIYLILLSLWIPQTVTAQLKRWQWVLVVTIIPGVCELAKVFYEYNQYTIYSLDDRARQRELMQITPKDAIILAAPLHNSPVTLSGRKLFLGYPGTLYTHGINYRERENISNNLSEALSCKKTRRAADEICPDYLLWTNNEMSKWNLVNPKGKGTLENTPSRYIYKIP